MISCKQSVRHLHRSEDADLSNISCIYSEQDNLFEWHFTIRGPGDSEFDGGVYHGRIILPPEYPMKPPSIILLTVSFVRVIAFARHTPCSFSGNV